MFLTPTVYVGVVCYYVDTNDKRYFVIKEKKANNLAL